MKRTNDSDKPSRNSGNPLRIEKGGVGRPPKSSTPPPVGRKPGTVRPATGGK